MLAGAMMLVLLRYLPVLSLETGGKPFGLQSTCYSKYWPICYSYIQYRTEVNCKSNGSAAELYRNTGFSVYSSVLYIHS